jgi:hypothetical protein
MLVFGLKKSQITLVPDSGFMNQFKSFTNLKLRFKLWLMVDKSAHTKKFSDPPFVCLFVHLPSVFPSVYLSVHLSPCLFICQFVNPFVLSSIHLLICPSTCLFGCPSIFHSPFPLSILAYVHPSTHLSNHPSVSLSIRLFVCPSICSSIHLSVF